MGSLYKKLKESRKYISARKRKNKKNRPDDMISDQGLFVFRLMMFAFFMMAIANSGYAPPKAPKLPEDFCEHGDVTATTGECMCHWQHKDGCKGSGCEYQMGLSFYHYSCKDCSCVKEP
mmetsp:Transcript_25326/g.54031  ORF Transcript_25326/g.54031 Transcript_25326/m.54031 type:complete len:119 (+) Transcript_25326:146-502(+)